MILSSHRFYFFFLWVLLKIFQKKLQNGSCSTMVAMNFGWLARWDVKYEWSYSNLDESLDYEVMVVWYSPSRILMIFKTNNHFLSVEKCCVVREIAKFLKSSSVMFIHLENWSAFSKSKLHNSTFQEIISYLI